MARVQQALSEYFATREAEFRAKTAGPHATDESDMDSVYAFQELARLAEGLPRGKAWQFQSSVVGGVYNPKESAERLMLDVLLPKYYPAQLGKFLQDLGHIECRPD